MLITVAAAHVKQGSLSLYTTALKVGDLTKKGFYSIERLDPDDKNGLGYQRLLQKRRAKILAEYIIEGLKTEDAFLPTSVFLATNKNIEYNKKKNTISFNTDNIGPFSVVDGQHRLEGLKMATDIIGGKSETRGYLKEISNFEIPVNIAYNLPKLHQMCHFLIVNTTQKSVDTSVKQNIYARLTELTLENNKDIPNLPRWIKTIINKGDINKALKIVRHLNETKESPFYGKIQMANQTKPTATLKQDSFIISIEKFILTLDSPLYTITKGDFNQQMDIILNYWKAIANLLDSERNFSSSLYRDRSVRIFSKFLKILLQHIMNNGDRSYNSYNIDSMQEHLKYCFDNIKGDYQEVGQPGWWQEKSMIKFSLKFNPSTYDQIVKDMRDTLNKKPPQK